MNPPTMAARIARPADSPPPRDPKAAGPSAENDTPATEHAFGALVDQAAQDDPKGTELSAAEQPSKEDKDKPAPDASSEPVPIAVPLLAQPQALAPPATQSQPQSAKTAPERNSSTLSLTPSATPAEMATQADRPNAVLDSAKALPEEKAAHKNKAVASAANSENFGSLLNETSTTADAAPLATPANALTKPAEPPALAPPPPPSAPPLPIVALPATIAIKALEGINRFDIKLDPEDLGRIDIALEIDPDGSIRAAIAADNPDALQLIVREARALEQAFDQAGFRREENALSFSLSDQHNPSGQQHEHARSPVQTTRFFVDGEVDLPQVASAMATHATGRLDVRI